MKIILIEDEIAAARRLQKLLEEYNGNIEVVKILDSIEASVDYLSNESAYDLIFMDIHLADGSSFEIFNHIKFEKPIIFTTAFDEYAIQAFKVNAVDYILKPVKKVELENAMAKVEKMSQSSFDYEKITNAILKDEYNKRFLIKIGQQIKVISMNDVAYFYTQDKITFMITKSGKRFPIDYSLERIDEIVNPQLFFRINRQFIVSLDSISEMFAYSKSRVKLILNPNSDYDTIVSTERSPHFKKWLVGELS